MKRHEHLSFLAALLATTCAASGESPDFDVLVRGGTIYDGSGQTPYEADLGIRGDRIVSIGDLSGFDAELEIDAGGKAVAPGFINVLSWGTESLIEDGRSLGDIVQGVTLEVFGEGWSMGPLNGGMKAEELRLQGDIRYDIEWTTLAEYLEFLERRGVSTNVASFVGATTVRIHELGYEDRAPTPEELERMRGLVRAAMEDGALGVGSSLIYAPAFYAETDELVALCEVAAEHGGRYITHIRSEGNRLLEAVDEVLEIARRAGIGAEIYHLKAAGEENWPKLEQVFARIEEARAEGLDVTADMYTYTAAATGLTAAMPPWVQEGGHEVFVERLREPEVRRRVIAEMRAETDQWENLLLAAGSPERVLLVGFKSDDLKPLTGRTLAAVAAEREVSAEEAAVDLVIEDDSRVGSVYFVMSEDNVEKKIARAWVSFGSDEASQAPEGVFLKSNPHPRANGNFARLLGRYVRERGVISLEEAVRRLTAQPAENLRLRARGRLLEGYHADIVVFDPATVADRATFDAPHELATGVEHVLVNGVRVLADGEHTGATPGRVVRGPGWTG